MKVEVVMAWPRRHRVSTVELAENATLAEALRTAGMDDVEGVTGYAIFGVNATLSSVLRNGDRIELLRPLVADPKDARRRRASQRKS